MSSLRSNLKKVPSTTSTPNSHPQLPTPKSHPQTPQPPHLQPPHLQASRARRCPARCEGTGEGHAPARRGPAECGPGRPGEPASPRAREGIGQGVSWNPEENQRDLLPVFFVPLLFPLLAPEWRSRCIGVLFGCFGRKIAGDSWFWGLIIYQGHLFAQKDTYETIPIVSFKSGSFPNRGSFPTISPCPKPTLSCLIWLFVNCE